MKLGGGIHDAGLKIALISVLAAAPVLIAAFVWERRRNAASARLRAAVTANTAAAERLVAAVGQVGEAHGHTGWRGCTSSVVCLGA